jgi:dTDP-D-glucose 4,6-dehydratase
LLTYSPSPFLPQGAIGEVYNIASREEKTVLDVAADICACFGISTESMEHVRDRLFNDRRYFIDATKLHTLGWNPVSRKNRRQAGTVLGLFSRNRAL